MTAPRGAVGRTLLTEARSWDDPLRIRWETTVIDGYAAIRAVEAEARTMLLADIRKRVEGLRPIVVDLAPDLAPEATLEAVLAVLAVLAELDA
jgi:hypothetical protein